MTQPTQVPTTISLFNSEPSRDVPTRLARVRSLLDRALLDFTRAERSAVEGSNNKPLYRPEIRWSMVEQARRLLEDV